MLSDFLATAGADNIWIRPSLAFLIQKKCLQGDRWPDLCFQVANANRNASTSEIGNASTRGHRALQLQPKKVLVFNDVFLPFTS